MLQRKGKKYEKITKKRQRKRKKQKRMRKKKRQRKRLTPNEKDGRRRLALAEGNRREAPILAIEAT